MNALRKLVRILSSWSLTPLLARGALLLSAVIVLAHIGKGALGHLDDVAVTPVYAATRLDTPPGSSARAAPGADGTGDTHGHGADGHGANGTRDAHGKRGAKGHGADGHGAKGHGAAGEATMDELSSCAAGGTAPGCDGQHAPGLTADGRVILNTATVDEFTRLPGIGKSRAESIVALRKKLGRFRRVRDLLRVRGIGFKSLKKLKPLVVLDPPKEP